MSWTPNKVTLLRVLVGFAAVSLFGRGAWANLAAVGLTVASIALDALDGHIARTKQLATPVGAQIDILGDRMIENVYFTYFAVVGMVSLWLPVFFFARGAFGMECECDASDLVGTRAGGFAMEPRIVCGDEVPVLLLFGIGTGADTGASGADW